MRKSGLSWFRDALLAVLALFAFAYPFIYPPKPLPKQDVIAEIVADIPDFRQFTNVIERKKAFFGYLMPEVEKQNSLVLEQRHWLMSLARKVQEQPSLSSNDSFKLGELMQQYKVSDELDTKQAINLLLTRVDMIPIELVLVQAANESAWGTSRFARLGYNFFGMWCFKPGCGFVPARRPDGATNEVSKFPNLGYAVRTYLTNLNRHPAYQEFRAIRTNLRENQQPITAEALAQGLMSYSERGQDYIDELLEMMRVNRKYMKI